MDLVQAYLLILLGAAISNAIDTKYQFTPALGAWLQRVFGI